MDEETLEYLKAELEQDLLNNQERIIQQVEEELGPRPNEINQADQIQTVQSSPAFNHNRHEATDIVEQNHERNENSYDEQFNALVAEKTTEAEAELGSIYFSDYGGSLEEAERLVYGDQEIDSDIDTPTIDSPSHDDGMEM